MKLLNPSTTHQIVMRTVPLPMHSLTHNDAMRQAETAMRTRKTFMFYQSMVQTLEIKTARELYRAIQRHQQQKELPWKA